MGLCKELEGHIFDYGGHGAADTMRVIQEKIQQYVGIKFGKDVANEIKFSKTETAVTQSEGTAFSLKGEMES